MTVQLSVALRTAMAAAVEATTGASPLLELFTGAQPANCAAADSGTKLASLTLPADAFADAASGAVAKSGTWAGTGIAAGSAAHFRLKTSGGTVVAQGSVTITGGGGDLILDNVSIAIGQAISISGFTLTVGSA